MKFRRDWLDDGRAHPVFTSPFDSSFVNPLDEDLRRDIIRGTLIRAARLGVTDTAAIGWLRQRIERGEDSLGWYALCLGEHFLLTGDIESAERLAAGAPASNDSVAPALIGCLHALRGEFKDAAASFVASLRAYRRFDKRRPVCLDGLSGTLHCATLLRFADAESLKKLRTFIDDLHRGAGPLVSPWLYPFDVLGERPSRRPRGARHASDAGAGVPGRQGLPGERLP